MEIKNCIAVAFAAGLFVLPAAAQTTEVERFVSSIKSVAQVKTVLRDVLTVDCASGSCANNNATQICSLVGALDVRLGGAISTRDPKLVGQMDFAVSPADLRTMKLIWGQCRPTNYQYWNYPTVLHVAYEPDSGVDREIRSALGLPTVGTEARAGAGRGEKGTEPPPKTNDQLFASCLSRKVQPYYSSRDGGKSAKHLLEHGCPSEYLAWAAECTSSGESRYSCVNKAALSAQAAIKLANQ